MMTISRRPQIPADDLFVRQLILAATAEELGAAEWPEPLRSQILELQYASRLGAVRAQYGATAGEIILADNRNAGWLVVAELAGQIRLVEILVCGEMRSQGIGSAIIREVLAAGKAAGKPVRLRVQTSNTRALDLYRRLGFQRVDGDQVQQEMECRP